MLVVVVVEVVAVVVFGVVVFTAPIWLSLRYGDGWDGVDSFGTFSRVRWCACDVDASPAVNEIDVGDEAKSRRRNTTMN